LVDSASKPGKTSAGVTIPDDLVVVGHVLGAYGVQGWVRVHPYSAQADALKSAKTWWLDKPEIRDIDRLQFKLHGGDVLAQLQGVVDRDAAEAMKGTLVSVSRSRFPATDEDEYYWSDLTGLSVENLSGELLGQVTGLIDNGAHPILRVFSGVTGSAERLIPFVDHFVKQVDLPNKKITVDWGVDY
jgi:16S rRNA processing protein RimM